MKSIACHTMKPFLATCLITIVGFSFFALSSPAQAKLEICNQTQTNRDVAIGYKGSDGWTSEGWWKLDVGECKSVVKEQLTRRFFYYRAVHKGKDFDPGKFAFCTQSDAFTIVDSENCETRGHQKSFFRELKLAKGTLAFRLTLDNETIYDADRDVAKATPKAILKPEFDPDSPRGTFGEPYTITGMFIGCDDEAKPLSCRFYADEWDYHVVDDGKSHAYLLSEINEFSIGDEYTIIGDMISYKDSVARITVKSYQAAPAPQNTASNTSSQTAPGTHGEPYTVTGIFRGCDSESGPYMCEFETDGWRYMVIDDGLTDSAIINELSSLQMNQNYQIEGDITNFGDITAEVTLRRYSEMVQSGEQNLLNSIVGDWRSIEDPNSIMRITSDGKKWDEYDGDFVSEGDVSFTTQCDDPSVQSSDQSLLQINDTNSPSDVYCYSIIEASSSKLVLMYLPRGNFLEYEMNTTPN